MVVCGCGCRTLLLPGRHYVHGHNQRGTSPSPETLAKRHAVWGASSPMKGKTMSAESRARMRAAPRGKRGPMPNAQREKISRALSGRPSPLRIHPVGQPRDRRAYDAQNRDRKALRTRAWALAHPARRQAAQAKRRAAKLAAPGRGVTPEQWSLICEEYGYRCAYCAEVRSLEMDHIEPLSRGGAHDTGNIAPACGSCNASKADKALIVWLARRAA